MKFSSDFKVHEGIDAVINSFATKMLFYESAICSCVADNNGIFDPADDCTLGFRYKPPVEYNLMRTQIIYKKLNEQQGQILQGGCVISIPRKQLNHHATVTTLDLSGNVNLVNDYKITLGIDGQTPQIINLKEFATTEAAVNINEILKALNNAGLGDIAYNSGADGDPNLTGYITIRSLKILDNSKIELLPTANDDAMLIIFGFEYNIIKPDSTTSAFLPLYHKISRSDVIVIDNRIRRNGDILKKSVRDEIYQFDIERITNLSIRETTYQEGIDFTLINSKEINWIADIPDNTAYTVEYLCKQNYIVYGSLSIDRGSDIDRVSKKIYLALRNYANTQELSTKDFSA